MTAKVATKQAEKKKRLKPYIRASKTLYFLLLGLGFCVIVWFGYQVFNQVTQGYDSYNKLKVKKLIVENSVTTNIVGNN